MITVAVVGLGLMGSRMARRLLEHGHEVVVWNRTSSKAVPLVEAGAIAAATPSDAARRADAVIVMVADPPALDDIGAQIASSGAECTLIQSSTVGVGPVQRLASILPPSIGLIDAPVLGSIDAAESGTLQIFAAGDRALVDRWSPLLEVLGSVMYVGDIGAGSAAKLVANSTLFGVLGILGESLALARGLSLSDETAFEVLGQTSLAAQMKRRRPMLSSGEFPKRFPLSLAVKDATLILAATDLDLRIARAARSWFADAAAAGLGEKDYAAVLAYIEGIAGEGGESLSV